MANIVIAYHSGNHHTEAVALEVAKGAESAGASVIVHNIEDPVERLWNDLAAADAIIFGCPTYMGDVSAAFKKFAEETSKPWFKQEWANKLAAGFTNSGTPAGDKLATLQSFAVLAAQHGMVWVNCGVMPSAFTQDGQNLNRAAHYLGLGTTSESAPVSESNPPQEDRATARLFGAHVATAAARWVAGKSTLAQAA
ncbi:MAG: NADPH-dependent FMN reductase [Pseudomonas fluorescens]|nr:MAG: NADPH-dependent FMN reductase [Pseudomonas fluorescens]